MIEPTGSFSANGGNHPIRYVLAGDKGLYLVKVIHGELWGKQGCSGR